jgi:ribonuclease BN (tRNA processing enzyme)
VIGCAGLFPSPSSAASSYLLESPGQEGRSQKVLIDLGNGAMGPLQRLISPTDLDAILLSNLELDHCADFWALYVILRYGPYVASKMPIYGPPATLERLVEIISPQTPAELSSVFEVSELTDQSSFSIGCLTVTPYKMNNSADRFGFRVKEDDSIFAYTGDADTCTAMSSLANQADLLLADATFLEQRDRIRNKHMTGRRAGTVASHASVKHLVLTHLPVWTDTSIALAEAAETYAGRLDLARPGQVYELL